MPDGREPAHLHPDDLAALAAALQGGPIRMPPAPAEVPSGIDARVISEAVRAIVGEKVSSFLTREQIRELFDERVASKAWAEAVVQLIDQRLGNIGLRMDEDHIDVTRDSLAGSMKWNRWASKTFMAAAGTIVLGGVYALMKKIGLPVPAP